MENILWLRSHVPRANVTKLCNFTWNFTQKFQKKVNWLSQLHRHRLLHTLTHISFSASSPKNLFFLTFFASPRKLSYIYPPQSSHFPISSPPPTICLSLYFLCSHLSASWSSPFLVSTWLTSCGNTPLMEGSQLRPMIDPKSPPHFFHVS